MASGSIHKTKKYGDLVVLNYKSSSLVYVKFSGTGFETTAESGDIRIGNVKDKFYPRVYGVGFIGEGKFPSSKNGRSNKAYKTWSHMLSRCYSDKVHADSPSYIGCTVCDEWHNFQNFAEWFNNNYIEGLHLDKDIKKDGNKIYDPKYCSFVSQADNSIKASAKNHEFISPSGGIVNIYNLTKFCSENNLSQSAMCSVHNGIGTHHKGWKAIKNK